MWRITSTRIINPPITGQPTTSAIQYNNLAVLVAEIPNAGTRWRQANFDKNTFESFFGLMIGDKTHGVKLQHISANGSLENIETRQGVSVKSHNYRLELGAASGDYPTAAPPIVVFIKVDSDVFRYRLLMPDDPEFPTISSFLKANWNGPSNRKMRIITDTNQLRADWPQSPLWINAGTLF
jgi:hypothetical protein